jgi:hypothetical protein
MIIPAKQGAVAQGWAETLYNPALDGDDGLQVDARANAVEASDTAKYRG